MKSVERRFNDVAKRIQRKSQVLEMARKGLEGARQEIEQAHDWIKENIKRLQVPQLLGFESKAAEDRLQVEKVKIITLNNL